jgi:hypothetical protein
MKLTKYNSIKFNPSNNNNNNNNSVTQKLDRIDMDCGRDEEDGFVSAKIMFVSAKIMFVNPDW